jgi:hypothetical protein
MSPEGKETMSEAEVLHPASTEKEVRRLLRKHVQKLSRVLLTPEYHRTYDTFIRGQIGILEWLQREARRKQPSKKYRRLCRWLLESTATAQLGPLTRLTPGQLTTFDQVLNAILIGLCGGDAAPGSLDPAALISLQKRVLIAPKKRGPKNRSKYDEAFLRHMSGEEITSIARTMDAQSFQNDPVNAIQKYWSAIERRRQQALRSQAALPTRRNSKRKYVE